MTFNEWVELQLSDLRGAGLLRLPRPDLVQSGSIDAFSNDYFGLARSPVSRATLLARSPGAGSSRLIHGTRNIHERLEKELCDWVLRPAALLFSSGYAANLGTIAALADADTVVISDELNHASIIDGCRLSRAALQVVPHLDLAAVQEALGRLEGSKRAMVVTESYFSMDGDSPDLEALNELCVRYGAGLIVDEAHALGVFGPRGAGLCAQAGVAPSVIIGTLGKAVGVQGAFVAADEQTRTLLWNRARSFVFSTATSPLLTELTLENVQRLQAADSERTHLQRLAKDLRAELEHAGKPCQPSHGPILPLRTPDFQTAQRYEQALAQAGIVARAIRPPTVPTGTERLRLTVHADWPEDAKGRIVKALTEATI